VVLATLLPAFSHIVRRSIDLERNRPANYKCPATCAGSRTDASLLLVESPRLQLFYLVD
jgi:hypothetical protein